MANGSNYENYVVPGSSNVLLYHYLSSCITESTLNGIGKANLYFMYSKDLIAWKRIILTPYNPNSSPKKFEKEFLPSPFDKLNEL